MADKRSLGSRTFWIGALCGVAAAYVADRLRQRSRGAKHRFSLIRGGAAVVRIPLKRDDATGDPAALSPGPRNGASRL